MPRKPRAINPFNTDTADRIAKARATSGRKRDRLPPSGVKATRALARRPPFTPEMAAQLVRLLAAGIPIDDALVYFAPEHFAACDDRQRYDWAAAWSTDDLTIRALNAFNGGAWEELDPDRRLDVALNKALASLAYFLYTHDYSSCDGVDLKKHDAARKDLMEYLKVKSLGDEDSPWMAAMRDIVEGTLAQGVAPQLAAVPILGAKKGN